MIVTCETCGRVMGGTSCTDTRGYPWGSEPELDGLAVERTCRDCGTPPGGLHHSGCCVGECRVCHDQLLVHEQGECPAPPTLTVVQ